MSISRLIEPGDAVSTLGVEGNFKSFETDLADITTANIEDDSIRTRHIAVSQGAWKEITNHVSVATFTNPGGDTLMVPPATTTTATRAGQMVLVVATAQFESTGTKGSTSCTGQITLRVRMGATGVAVAVRTMDIRTLSPGKLQISTVYAFEATRDDHLIELWFEGGGVSCKVHKPEVQVIAVRG